MMMSEMLHGEILTRISLITLSIAVHNFGMGIPHGLPPFCGHVLMPWLSSSSGAVVVLVLIIQ